MCSCSMFRHNALHPGFICSFKTVEDTFLIVQMGFYISCREVSENFGSLDFVELIYLLLHM